MEASGRTGTGKTKHAAEEDNCGRVCRSAVCLRSSPFTRPWTLSPSGGEGQGEGERTTRNAYSRIMRT